MFFSNLILDTNYELKNRYMRIDYVQERVESISQSAADATQKGKISTLNCSLDELEVLQMIMNNPNITQKEIAKA